MGVMDIHSDIWYDVTAKRMAGETAVIRNRHMDRLKTGGEEGTLLVLWADPSFGNDYGNYAAITAEMMKRIREEIAECNEKDFRIVHNMAEINKAKEDGIFYVMIGVEGMAYASEDISRIDEYYELGARHGMLTWNEVNKFGAAAASGETYGLTDLGKEAVKICQSKGMLMDTSHLNDAGFYDMISITSKPIIASHSNSRALCNVPRNITDDMMREIRDCNGLVGINAFKNFVDLDPAKQDVEHLAQHVAHMVDVMGIDHVACGFDFFEFIEDEDSMASMDTAGEAPGARGLDTAAQIPNFFNEFKKMGMTAEEMDKIAHGNIHRVIKETIG